MPSARKSSRSKSRKIVRKSSKKVVRKMSGGAKKHSRKSSKKGRKMSGGAKKHSRKSSKKGRKMSGGDPLARSDSISSTDSGQEILTVLPPLTAETLPRYVSGLKTWNDVIKNAGKITNFTRCETLVTNINNIHTQKTPWPSMSSPEKIGSISALGNSFYICNAGGLRDKVIEILKLK